MSARLLLVEDDPALAEMLAELLTDEGYDVAAAADGQAGLNVALSRPFDVMVLDRRLPGIEGVDLLRRLRGRGVASPALFLTARAEVSDRVEGLDAGAQDYLVKPFDVEELLARLRALLRRAQDTVGVLRIGEVVFAPDTRLATRGDGSTVGLSATEAELLEVLARHPKQVYPRDQLLDLVFDDAARPGSVDTYVHYLRHKLGRDVVRTVRGIGYQAGS